MKYSGNSGSMFTVFLFGIILNSGQKKTASLNQNGKPFFCGVYCVFH